MGRRKKIQESAIATDAMFDGTAVPEATAQERVETKRHVSRALDKMRKVNALASSCNNEKLVNLFLSLPEGEFLLDVFAEAVDKKLQVLYSGTQEEEVGELSQTVNVLSQVVDTLYQKVVAMNASPLMGTLNALSSKLGGVLSPSGNQPVQQSAPVPQSGEAQMLAQLHMQASQGSHTGHSSIRDAIQIESSVPSW